MNPQSYHSGIDVYPQPNLSETEVQPQSNLSGTSLQDEASANVCDQTEPILGHLYETINLKRTGPSELNQSSTCVTHESSLHHSTPVKSLHSLHQFNHSEVSIVVPTSAVQQNTNNRVDDQDVSRDMDRETGEECIFDRAAKV